MFAPMVKDMRDVMNASRPFRGAQGKIVVLRQIEFLSESANFLHERTPVRRQVADVHKRTEKLRAPFRFEKRRMPFPLPTKSVFVAVENFRLGKRGDGRGQLIQSEGRQEIVMVHARDVVPRGERESTIAVF